MRGQNGFELDTNKLDEVDHQLRLIRVFCNHAKHGDVKKNSKGDIIDRITMSAKFPLTFPVKFNHLKIGDKNIHAAPVVESVISFWELEIQNS